MITEKELNDLPKMVRWFDPGAIFKILKPVIVSGIFGQYADRRLIQAALDQGLPIDYAKRADIRKQFQQTSDGAVWIDFVADLGDGFDSTYAIASLLAQEKIDLATIPASRGSVLILGGDQVYPDATVDNYLQHFHLPYSWAFPDQGGDDSTWHPRIYAIPGNHDWYDGLDAFTGLFCSHKDWKVGNWRAKQERSYFALQLTDRVWLWGVDIQLSERVDQPQAAYFRKIAADMPQNSQIILCTAVPGWYGADDIKDKAFSSLGYFASSVLLKAKKDHRIVLVLSGDTHHYCRYKAINSGTTFITSGGGGAFLHPTHQLRNQISCPWWVGKSDAFELAKVDEAGLIANGKPACFPDKDESKALLRENKWFPFFNWKFSLMLGIIYSVLGLFALMFSDLSDPSMLISNPVWWIEVIALVFIFYKYADGSQWLRDGTKILQPQKPYLRKLATGIPHGVLQIVLMTVISQIIYTLLVSDRGLSFWSWPFNAAFVLLATFYNGILGSFLFGMYLTFTCRTLSINANDSYSAMSLNSHRHFLRLKITQDKITVFPIGLREIPKRSHWRTSSSTESSLSPSPVQPANPMTPQLIEGPIELKLV